jgi:hypothetical protein
MTAPEGSVTIPLIRPFTSTAWAEKVKASTNSRGRSDDTIDRNLERFMGLSRKSCRVRWELVSEYSKLRAKGEFQHLAENRTIE